MIIIRKMDRLMYYAYFLFFEVGRIKCNKSGDFLTIDRFQVREKFRKHYIGKRLLEEVLMEAEQNDRIQYIKVDPSSNPYLGDSSLKSEELYKVYWKLGFRFINHPSIETFECAEQELDLTKRGLTMKLDV